MALDTSIIRQATFQPVQFQMPSQANMLANAAQAVSGLQTLESNRMRMRQAQQEEAATSQMMQGIKRAYAMGETPESIQAYEEALIGSGQPQYVQAGMKLRMARMEDAKQRQEQTRLRQEYEQWASGGGQAAPAAVPVDNTLALGVETPATPPSQNMLAQGPADPYAARRQQLLRASQHPNPQIAAAAKLELSQMPRMTLQEWSSAGGGGDIYSRITGERRAAPTPAGAASGGARVPPLLNLTPEQVRTLADRERMLAEAKRRPTEPRGAPAPAPGPKPPKEEKPTVNEQQASTATRRLLQRAQEISAAVARSPKSEAPTMTEAAMENVPLLSRATNLVRSEDRQVVSSAQDDVLDALLYLATGAAYNKEQLQQQKSAYIPAWSDKPATREIKRQRLVQMIDNAKVRAGRAWTPELDQALAGLVASPVMRSGQQTTPAAAALPVPAGVDPEDWKYMTPQERSLWQKKP